MLVMIRKAPPRFVQPGKQPADNDWKALHHIADTHYPAMMQAFLDAVEAMRDRVTQEEIVAALAQGPDTAWIQMARAWELIGQPVLVAGWVPHMTTMLQAAAMVSQPFVVGLVAERFQVSLNVLFNQVNEAAVSVARRTAGVRITAINQTTLDGVRSILTRAFTEGRTPTQTARALAHSVGLTPGQVAQLANYQRGLEAQNIPFARQERLMRVRARRLLRQRGEIIARTETITTANAGQQALYEASQAQGFMPTDMKRFWLVTPGDRLCTTICRPIPGLNPQGRAITEPFATPRGGVMYPAAHPQCRCAVTLREGS